MLGKVFVTSNDLCARRELDFKKIKEYLKINNYKIATEEKKADFIICVTCGYRKPTEDQAIELIKELKRYNKEMLILGCLPAVNPDRLKKVHNGSSLPTNELNGIDRFFKHNIKFSSLPDPESINLEKSTVKRYSAEHETKLVSGKNEFAVIRIGWGCNRKCTFCAANKAVGDSVKSKPKHICIMELKNYLKKDYHNIMIVADNIGVYGLDIKSSLPDLISEMVKIKRSFKIRLQGLDPYYLVKYESEFIKLVKSGKIEEMIISLQSGSSKILKKMNRYSNVVKIKNAISNIKKISPSLKFSFYALIGFPSETEEDFNKTIRFIIDFANQVKIFPFTPMNNTPAYVMKSKVTKQDILARVVALEVLARKSSVDVQVAIDPIMRNIFREKVDSSQKSCVI